MRGRNRRAALVAALSLALAAPVATADEAAISHSGVECVVAERFPRLEARVPEGIEVARARIHFRPETTPHWYSVEMTRTGEALVGRLPRPKRSLAAFRYYIEVTDSRFASSRTTEYAPRVAATAAGCAGKVQAATETSATVVLTPTGGAPPIPAGFASSGVTTAVASSAATGAAAGGGIGATALIIGGAAVAAGAGVAVVAGGGGGSSGSGDSGGGGSGGDSNPGGPGGGGVIYHVSFEPSPPGIDVSACAGRALTWCCQVISATPDGTFDHTWAPSEPNTLRVAGRVTASTLEATLTCVSGGPAGSITASGSGGTYTGTFDFHGSRGTVTVRRD